MDDGMAKMMEDNKKEKEKDKRAMHDMEKQLADFEHFSGK